MNFWEVLLMSKTPGKKMPLLLFDYDGVIADSFQVYFEEFQKACALMGYDKLNSREEFLKLFDRNLLVQALRAGFNIRQLKKLATDFMPQMEKANARISPFPEMPSILAQLSRHYPTLIITSNATAVVRNFVETHKLHMVYDAIGSDIEPSKIKRIRKARRLFPAHEACYIGDTRGDMLEARRAGALPVGVGWGWHGKERLQSGRAVRFMDSPVDLLKCFLPELLS